MKSALAELKQEYTAVTGCQLDNPELDVFSLGLSSMVLLELVSRLRERGYNVQIDDVVDAESMIDIAQDMARSPR